MRRLLSIRFLRDAALTGGTLLFQALGAMVGGIIVARELGPTAIGTISVVVALCSLAVLLATFGVHSSSIYYLGRYQSDRAAIVSNNNLVGVIGGIATALILSAVVLLFQSEVLHGIALDLFFVYLLVVPFNYFNEFARRTALGLGRVSVYNLPDLLSGSALLFGTGAVIAIFGRHVAPLLVLRVALEISITLLLVYNLRRLRIRFKPSRAILRRQVAYGLRNYVSSLLWLVLLQSDILLCNHFLGSEKTGVYSIAVSLGLPVTMLGSVVGTLMFQRVSSDADELGRVANMNRALRLLTPLVIGVAGLIALAATWVVPIVWGDAFSPASTALLFLLPGLVSLSLEVVLLNFLAGEGSPAIVYRAPMVGVVINLAANLYAIPEWGINGASATSTIGYTVVFGAVLLHYTRSSSTAVRDVLIVRAADLRALRRTPRIHTG